MGLADAVPVRILNGLGGNAQTEKTIFHFLGQDRGRASDANAIDHA